MAQYVRESTIIRTVCSETDAKTLNSPRSSISSTPKLKILPSSTKDSIFCEQMSFKYEKEWSETADCVVCGQLFNKLKGVFKHHCRVCGGSCCGDCSVKKINDERVCDICYLRVENSELIEKKKGILALKDQLMEEMFSEFNGLALKNQDIDSQITDLQLGIKTDQKKYVEKMGNLREELKKNSENYKENLEKYKKLREMIKNDRETLIVKEKKLMESNKELSRLKEEVQSKEITYKGKTMELADYMRIFGKIKDCESFHHLKISLDDLSSLDLLHSNSKEHNSFLKSTERKKQFGFSNLSKFSSHKDLRVNSQSQGSGLFLFSKIPSVKDSLHSSIAVKSVALSIKEGMTEAAPGGCFCEKGSCKIF